MKLIYPSLIIITLSNIVYATEVQHSPALPHSDKPYVHSSSPNTREREVRQENPLRSSPTISSETAIATKEADKKKLIATRLLLAN